MRSDNHKHLPATLHWLSFVENGNQNIKKKLFASEEFDKSMIFQHFTLVLTHQGLTKFQVAKREEGKVFVTANRPPSTHLSFKVHLSSSPAHRYQRKDDEVMRTTRRLLARFSAIPAPYLSLPHNRSPYPDKCTEITTTLHLPFCPSSSSRKLS